MMSTPPETQPEARALQRVLDSIADEIGHRFDCDAVVILALQGPSAVGASKIAPWMLQRHGNDGARHVVARELQACAAQLIATPFTPEPGRTP